VAIFSKRKPTNQSFFSISGNYIETEKGHVFSWKGKGFIDNLFNRVINVMPREYLTIQEETFKLTDLTFEEAIRKFPIYDKKNHCRYVVDFKTGKVTIPDNILRGYWNFVFLSKDTSRTLELDLVNP